MPGREDYEERRQARIDRLNNAAASAAQESSQRFKRAHDMVKDIPFGQPNIIGRPALPALRERSALMMDKALELNRTANYYTERAEAAECNSAISSDDPTAIEKLQAKLAKLEATRDRVKAANKAAKKTGGEQSAWYILPYLARDIKSVKERIAKLQAVDGMPAELIEFDGGEIESNPTTNRVTIRYDEHQSANVTAQLKANGFRWAPSAQGWQRLRSPGALRLAKKLCDVDEIGPALAREPDEPNL
ncbi:MAG TPA: DUF3560 domain-containing protein [Candidatus Limiplasma sp.]|nr:DUF3560 domain-containing protein [Candidatus Limiplasma sp.]